ncbi:MAG TPA: SDR family oxidoreductase [Solirubrobacterales bacterium]|nr:SDR family oxidoreductase [Solirubrobacterales bacterium]
MAKERQSLSGKVVAISGGARGIGKATATALVRKGCRVAIGDLDLELAEKTAAELGGGTVALTLDVTDRGSFATFLDAAERELGPLDVVVNNAGIMPVTAFDAESDDSIRRQLDINVYGVIVGTQLASERLRGRGGHIVNVASAAGRAAVPGIATYSGTKHAVVGFSEAVRGELRGTGIELSCVMPVTVNTALTEGVDDTLGVKKVEPEDVANEIVDALEVPRFDVFVPSYLKYSIAIGSVLPRRLREAIARLIGTDKIMTNVPQGARRAYEERAAREDISGGGAEEAAEPSQEREAA